MCVMVPPEGNSSAPPSTVLAARDYALHARIEVIVRGKGQPARVVGHREVMETRHAVDELWRCFSTALAVASS